MGHNDTFACFKRDQVDADLVEFTSESWLCHFKITADHPIITRGAGGEHQTVAARELVGAEDARIFDGQQFWQIGKLNMHKRDVLGY